MSLEIARGKEKGILGKLGIFSSFLVFAAVATWIYSPILGSNADSNLTTHVGATIHQVAAVNIDASELVLNIAPTPSGAFASDSLTVNVSVNSPAGFELYFSSDGDSADLVSPSTSEVISSDFDGTVTSSTMAANTYGYSLDNVDFLKVPTVSEPVTLRNIDHFPETAEKTNTIYIGTKISSSLPSGEYSRDVVFTVVAHEPIDTTPIMQEFEYDDLTNVGDSIVLKDARDGSKYTVKKLADGNIWMTQNLRIANKTISSDDSNLPAGVTYAIPASNLSDFTEDYDTGAVYIDSTHGGYYNFYTATAGWGTQAMTSGSAPRDICPKGWRLPTGGSNGEFSKLYNSYNSYSLMQGDPGFTLDGMVDDGAQYDGTGAPAGYFWSSAVYYSSVGGYNGVYVLSLYDSQVDPADTYSKFYGYPVRCVKPAPTPTMQSFDKSTLANVGDSATLEDERDGNFYTVKKLADGNVWMTENLRLINKTISSTDSNLPSGETWTVPASNVSSFATTSYNTNSAYLDSTYGGYYTFYTATAGWGTNSVTSGNSPKDICPKGWRLPTGGSTGEFQTLYNNYNSAALMMGIPNFTLSGYVNNGSVSYQGSNGNFWSSTVLNAGDAYILYLNSAFVLPADYDDKTNGFSVRCVAR